MILGAEGRRDQDQGHTADDLTQVILKANGFPIGILNVDSLLNAITLSAGPETGEQENTEVECTASDAVQGALLLRAIAAYDMFVQDHESISGPLGASQGFGWVNRGIIAQIDPTRNDIRQRTFDTREGHNMTNITTPSLNDSLVDGSTDGDTEEEVADEDDTETGVENEDFDLDSEIDADSDSDSDSGDSDLADDAVAGVRSILFPSSDGVATDNYVSPMKKIGPERIQVSMSAQEPMDENADMQHKRVAIAMDVAEILGDDAEAEAYTAGDPLMARDASGFPTDAQFAAMSKADASSWWKSMPIHRKRAYLERHPQSKYGVAYRKAIEAKRRNNGKPAGKKTETMIERKAKPKKSKRTSGPVKIHKAKPKRFSNLFQPYQQPLPLILHDAPFGSTDLLYTWVNMSISRLLIPRLTAMVFHLLTPFITSPMIVRASSLPIIYSSQESSKVCRFASLVDELISRL
jgi:hypothetical protein